MDFKKLDEQAIAASAEARARAASEETLKDEAEAQNLVDAEEWLTRVAIGTLTKAKEQLAGVFSVDFHDDFTGVQTKSGAERRVTYSLSPPKTGSYAALPHHLVVDKHRQMKCTTNSGWEDVGPKVAFHGNIDQATVEDFEEHIGSLVKWWRSKGL